MSWSGAKLRALIKERGLTLIEVANKLNVSRQAINDWTKDQVPKGTHLIKLSNLLNVAPGHFFPEEKTEQITVPLHRKRGVAKVTPNMKQAATQMAREYENLFKLAPSPGLVQVLRIKNRDEKSAFEMANELRHLAKVESDKPMNYNNTFTLLSLLKIVIIFRDFPDVVKDYAFYCKIYDHRVIFVNNKTKILDLIFPILHETIHSIRDEMGIPLYNEEEEEHFCDSVASDIQFPRDYTAQVYNTIEGRKESHQINILKKVCSENKHSMFGIAEQIKNFYPSFKLNVAPADSNLRKTFPSIGDILFRDEDPKCYIDNLRELAPLFFTIVSSQINNVTKRKIGEWLGLESSLDAKQVVEEWKRIIPCN
jgi:transcriptional regulator with XRE-family HTH domain